MWLSFIEPDSRRRSAVATRLTKRNTTAGVPMLLLVSICLSGCTSLRGTQERLTSADIKRFEAVCPSREQLEDKHVGVSDGDYRDRVISICVQAINGKYSEFRDRLSLEAGSTALVTELLAQGLSTAASIVTDGSTARQLAAGSAFSLGVGATINRDLFYKQTMPAIIASMDARRSKIMTSIVKAQNRDPDAKTYTLERAGFDLDLLQQAGSIASAVQELTTSAVENRTEADEALNRAELVMDLGTAQDISADLDARFHAVAATVRKLEQQGKEAELRAIAASLGLAPQPGQDSTALSALIRIEAAKATTAADPQEQERIMQRMEGALAPYGSIEP